jgi:crossover junction endodeoxyribonuclease RuvC
MLGIDPGLGTTGWGVIRVQAGTIHYVDSGSIQTKSTEPIGLRLRSIFEGLQAVIRQHGVTACAVESGYVGAGAQSALALGQARAAAVLAAEMLDVRVELPAPREIKMAVTGRGAATKTQVAYVVGKMLGIAFDRGEEDISDALAAAICGVLHSQKRVTVRVAR